MSANGRLDVARELVAVSGTYLQPVTATAFARMQAACLRATGVTLDIVNGSGGYRDWDAQVYLCRHPPAGVTVSFPGFSTHGRGFALDVTTTCFTPDVAAWLRTNCRTYGFAVPPANDPRHFFHNGVTTGPTSSPAGIPGTAIPSTTEEPHMSFFVSESTDSKTFFVTSAAGVAVVDLTKAVAVNAGTMRRLADALIRVKDGAGDSNDHIFVGRFFGIRPEYPAWAAPTAAATVNLQPVLDAINAIDRDPTVTVDLSPVLSALNTAAASINANIDDQPTEFTITPA